MGSPMFMMGRLISNNVFRFSVKKAKYLKNPKTKTFAIIAKTSIPFLLHLSRLFSIETPMK